jgi:hypothetical protein
MENELVKNAKEKINDLSMLNIKLIAQLNSNNGEIKVWQEILEKFPKEENNKGS